METTSITKKFSPVKLGAGIALIIFGLYLSSWLLQGIISIKGILGGLAAIAGGGYLLLKPFSLACAKCNKVLSDTSTHVADGDSEALVAALKAKDVSNVLSILNTSEIPAAVEYGDTRLVLGLEYCEQCKSVGRMRSLKATFGESEASSKEDVVIDWQEFSDPQISEILDKSGERNLQQSASRYNATAV